MKFYEVQKIRGIVAAYNDEKIKPSIAYKFMKLLKETESENEFYRKQILDIIHKYSEKDENGKPLNNAHGVIIQKGMRDECQKAINELEEMEVDVPPIRFTLQELDEIRMSVSDIFAFDELIMEE